MAPKPACPWWSQCQLQAHALACRHALGRRAVARPRDHFLFLKRDLSRYRSRRGEMDLSKARCMQSAQRVLFVVRRGTTWLFRVTWSFSRWDVDAVAHQHAIARAKDPCLSLLQWRAGARWRSYPAARKTTCRGMIMLCLDEQQTRPSVHYARHRQAESPSPLLSGPTSGKCR